MEKIPQNLNNWRNWPTEQKRALLRKLIYLRDQGYDLSEYMEAKEDESDIATLDEIAANREKWPEMHVVGKSGEPVPFHMGQTIVWESDARFILMAAGFQGGKTVKGPWWLDREIRRLGRGDYLAVTSNFTLFDQRMLPALQEVFVNILGIGRYWGGNKRIIELRDPSTGQFWAKTSNDAMWARIILRSAEQQGGLESSTAKAAWLDECGQPQFDLATWRAIRRRLAIWRGRVLMTTTLYELGWLVDTFINPAKAKGELMIQTMPNGAEIEYTSCSELDIDLVQYDSIVNPDFSIDEYREAEDSYPEDEFQMMLRGRVSGYRHLIYDCFDADPTKPNTVKKFKVPRDWDRYVGIDFGGVNLAVLYLAENPKSGDLYAYKELMLGMGTIEEYASEILEGEESIPYAVGGALSEDQWRRDFANNGLPLYVPDFSDVALGIQYVYRQFKKRKLFIMDHLVETRKQIRSYRFIKDADGNPTRKIKDKQKFHFPDALRYIIGKIRPHDRYDVSDYGDLGSVDVPAPYE